MIPPYQNLEDIAAQNVPKCDLHPAVYATARQHVYSYVSRALVKECGSHKAHRLAYSGFDTALLLKEYFPCLLRRQHRP